MATATVPPPVEVSTPREPARNGGRQKINRTLKYALLLVFVVVVLIPAYVLVITSFKGPADADPSTAWLLPTAWERGDPPHSR